MMDRPKFAGPGPGGPPKGPNPWIPDKSGDTELQKMIRELVPRFSRHRYRDEATGLTVEYSLFRPEGWDGRRRFPMVVFIGDASTAGKAADVPLAQGWGGLVWASEDWQREHPCLVMVPQYPEVVLDDHGAFTTTDYVWLTPRMIRAAAAGYAADRSRIYGTGQSMGCMVTMLLQAKDPALFAATLPVGGQWDIPELLPLKDRTFCSFAAEGDLGAYERGTALLVPALEEAGAKPEKATWNARWPRERLESAAAELLDRGAVQNFVVWERGSVLPPELPAGSPEHMHSFDHAYRIRAVREWLFRQSLDRNDTE